MRTARTIRADASESDPGSPLVRHEGGRVHGHEPSEEPSAETTEIGRVGGQGTLERLTVGYRSVVASPREPVRGTTGLHWQRRSPKILDDRRRYCGDGRRFGRVDSAALVLQPPRTLVRLVCRRRKKCFRSRIGRRRCERRESRAVDENKGVYRRQRQHTSMSIGGQARDHDEILQSRHSRRPVRLPDSTPSDYRQFRTVTMVGQPDP